MARFLRNLYRRNEPPHEPRRGMLMVDLASAETALGEPVLSDEELAGLVCAFESTGFTGSIHWYRNLDRNWHLLADVVPIVRQPALMIYGDRDVIPRAPRLSEFVPRVEVVGLDCGHSIQQENPQETGGAILTWLEKQDATSGSNGLLTGRGVASDQMMS